MLIGGSPTRVVRLKPAAADRIADRELLVADPVSRALALRLLDTGLGDPVAASLPPVPLTELTVVVPGKDRRLPLDRLLASLPAGLAAVIVVDDGSADPAGIAQVVHAHGAALVPLPASRGVGGARNAGLALVQTPFVAFVDSDVVVEPGCFETLVRHFADPRLAVVAPRVLGLDRERPGWITRYENARSSLDLGADAAEVRPRSPLSWVSGTCLIARVELLGTAFDASMDAGEDVDLVWRLVDEGHRVRFDPSAAVRHEHRTTVRAWMRRKFFYGTGADPLAVRHPVDIAPVVLPPWGALVLVALLAQRRWSLPLSAAVAAVVTARIARRLPHVEHPGRIAARLTANGVAAVVGQGSALLVRHWWPLTVIGGLFSRRIRRAALIAGVADAAWEYARLRPQLDPVRFALARRLDDLAYGAGVWWSAVRGRSPRALLPAVTVRARPRDDEERMPRGIRSSSSRI